MYLSKTNIVFYLFERGLLGWDTYVQGTYSIRERIGRNFSFFVRTREKHLFVKQLKITDDSNKALFQTESSVYENFQKEDWLYNFLPKYYSYDPVHHVIVIEWLIHTQSALEAFNRKKHQEKVLSSCANVLSDLHQINLDGLFLNFRNWIPWILRLNEERVQYGLFNELKNAEIFLLEVIKQDAILEKLSFLCSDWRITSLLHGDIKLDNFLVSKDFKSDRLGVWLIDWELAYLGDSLWDIACLIQSITTQRFLNREFQFFSHLLPLHPILDDDILVSLLQNTLHSYTSCWNINDFRKLIMYVGCRIIERLVEETQLSILHDERHFELLRLAQEMIINPNEYESLLS